MTRGWFYNVERTLRGSGCMNTGQIEGLDWGSGNTFLSQVD